MAGQLRDHHDVPDHASIGLAGAYGFYALCAMISAVFVMNFVRETNGKELEAMSC